MQPTILLQTPQESQLFRDSLKLTLQKGSKIRYFSIMRYIHLLGLCLASTALIFTSCDNNSHARGVLDETETQLSGILRDSTGLAVSQCTVWVRPIELPANAALSKVSVSSNASAKATFQLSDAQGQFTFNDLASGVSYAMVAKSAAIQQGLQFKFKLGQSDSLQLDSATRMSALTTLSYKPTTSLSVDSVQILELGLTLPYSDDGFSLTEVPVGTYTIVPVGAEDATVVLPSESATSSNSAFTWQDSVGVLHDLRDNNLYGVVKIGDLYWTTDNYRYAVEGSQCNSNDPYFATNCGGYGRYYTFSQAIQACPADWRVPTSTEWMILLQNAGGIAQAGVQLKSKTLWSSNNGQDTFGLNIRPYGDLLDQSIGNTAWFWSSSITYGTSNAATVMFNDASNAATMPTMDTTNAYTIRCVK